MRDAFIQTLLEEARRDENIILMTGDLGFGVLDSFQKELPKQFINSGVNEQALMGMAAGIASTGKRVFVYSIGNFPTLRCLEQIRNDVCLMNNSVVVVSVGAGYAYGPQGYTHHALEDIAVMRALPNLDVLIPSDPIEASLLTRYLTKSVAPSYLRLGKSNEKIINNGTPIIEYGKFNEIVQGGAGTFLFVGSVGTIVLNAADMLRKQGSEISVASAPFLTSMDKEFLVRAAEKGPIITIEEHSRRGGFGSSLLEFLNKENIQAKVGIVAAEQKNLSQIGSQEFLRDQNSINESNILAIFKVLLED